MRNQLIRIAERAASLDERLDEALFVSSEETPRELRELRINKWRRSVSRGDDAIFQRRLQMDGIDSGAVARVIGVVRFRDTRNLPPWVQMLEKLIAATEFVDRRQSPVRRPFDEALFAYARLARAKLLNVSLLTSQAVDSLEEGLLLQLSRICSRPLALDLNVARLLEQLQGETPQARYYDFIRNKIATPHGMLSFFSEYPVAARLVVTAVTQWIDSTNEFLSRLQNDMRDITRLFGAGTPPGEVITIFDHISDSHNGGRAAKMVCFASGLKVIYKPKDLTLDEGFQDLLEWINAGVNETSPVKLRFKTFQILNRKTHGWVEFLQPQPCRDLMEIDRYFLRAGMLLCLLHTLGATDCNQDNLFACGEYPVLIDHETLMELHQRPPVDRPLNAEELAQERCRMSLLYTGMLPRWVFGDPGASGADLSGLMAGKEQQYPFRIAEWVESETDNIRLEFTYKKVKSSTSRIMLNDTEMSAPFHQEKIEQGFQEMHEFLLRSKELLLKSGLLDRLCAGEVRYLNRATIEYALIQQKSLDPSLLKDGIDRSIHLDLLYRNLFLQDKESSWSLVKAERQALERLDIPYFSALAAESELLSDRHDIVPNFTLTPARDRLFLRLENLSDEDMKTQIDFMRASWSMRAGSNAGARSHLSARETNTPLLNQDDLVQTAAKIGEIVKNSAIRSSDGTVTWIGAEYLPELNQFSIVPVGSFFYSGKSGIAFFLAALHRFRPGNGYDELALGAMKTIRGRFKSEKARLYAGSIGLGALSGLGSICWSLLHTGKLLNQRDLVEDAATVASFMTLDLIANDRYLDIVSGSAGAILCLLELDRNWPDGGFRNLANECGKHLLEKSIPTSPEIRAWKTVRGEMLAGYSHGASGFAYALFRLYSVTGKAEYRDAAVQAMGYERSLFSREQRNWPDLRMDTPAEVDKFMVGWCHGAPGITLSRIGCLPYLDNTEIKDEIEIGLDTTLNAPLSPIDDICCGNFSRIEILQTASKYLNRADLYRVALLNASALVHLAAETGFRLDPNIGGGLNPGFMKGIAGIGYGLLRLADESKTLPTPLLMNEAPT